jgi:hypothetical protein
MSASSGLEGSSRVRGWRLLRLSAAAVLAAYLVCGGVFWFGGPAFSEEPEHFCPGFVAREATSYSTEISLWPPLATDCQYTTASGAVRTSTYMPWLELLVAGLLLICAALALASVRRTSSKRVATWFAAAAVIVGLLSFLAVGLLAPLLISPLLGAGALVAGLLSGTAGESAKRGMVDPAST